MAVRVQFGKVPENKPFSLVATLKWYAQCCLRYKGNRHGICAADLNKSASDWSRFFSVCIVFRCERGQLRCLTRPQPHPKCPGGCARACVLGCLLDLTASLKAERPSCHFFVVDDPACALSWCDIQSPHFDRSLRFRLVHVSDAMFPTHELMVFLELQFRLVFNKGGFFLLTKESLPCRKERNLSICHWLCWFLVVRCCLHLGKGNCSQTKNSIHEFLFPLAFTSAPVLVCAGTQMSTAEILQDVFWWEWELGISNLIAIKWSLIYFWRLLFVSINEVTV